MPNRKDTLRVHRTRAGLTLAQVAQKLGVRPATISENETGKTIPSGLLLQGYADLYGCSASDIELSPRVAA
jgi:transcriptional regulator with XRE-family HTH domain